jgi:type II secretory pathway component PulK
MVRQELMATTESPEHGHEWADDYVPIAELARRQGVRPIKSVDELAEPDAFESREELGEFLADLYASRRADVR